MLILGLMWGVRQILKLNQGPVGAGKYSFSIMRQQIKSKFQSERIKLIGKDGNLIDSILIPCNNMFNQLYYHLFLLILFFLIEILILFVVS